MGKPSTQRVSPRTNMVFSRRYTEQRVLRISMLATATLAVFGLVLGLLAGSAAIIFDSIYDMTDAGMTFLALLVANLIRNSTSGDSVGGRLAERFTMGFWHLEPIVLGMSGTLLIAAAVYALINAIDSFMSGGRQVQFGYAVFFAAVSLAGSVAMTLFARRANRRIRSDFIALDARGWFMAAALTAAWLAAFVFGYAIERTEHAWIAPYIDPAVLALVCLVVIPIPVGTVRRALADILLVTPADLKRHVDEVALRIVERHGFDGYRAYVARVGRGRQIELYFIVPTRWPARRLEEWDQLRDEIGEAIGNDTPDRWLTIVFTTDPEWAGDSPESAPPPG